MSTIKVIINNDIHRFKHKLKNNVDSLVSIFEKLKTIIEEEYKNQYITINQFYSKDLEKYKDLTNTDKYIKFFMYKCSNCDNVILDYSVCDSYGFPISDYESSRNCDSCEDFDNEILKLKLDISK